jgi:hypothetical protein
MKNKIVKYFYYFTPLILIIINTIIISSRNEFFYTFIPDKITSFISETESESLLYIISTLIFDILFIFLIVNLFIIIFKSENRKKYFFHIVLEIIEFIILHLILTLIISTIIWYKRDEVLLSIIGVDYFKFSLVFYYIFIAIMMINYIIILLINVRKSFRLNKKICILLLPAKYFILYFFSIFFLFGVETLCVWDPLADTKYSDTFNIYNLDKVKEGMTIEQIDLLVGKPLWVRINEEGIEELRYTGDGKNKFRDYAWVYIQLDFKDNILKKKEVKMIHD